jgi:hypothetical protein
MTIKIEFQIGRKKYKLYDYEAAQLYNKLTNYFESVGAFNSGKVLSGCQGKELEIGFRGEEEEE